MPKSIFNQKTPQKRNNALLKDWQHMFQESKNQLAVQSPALPMLGLFEINSSINEFPFDESVTSLGAKGMKYGFTQALCKDHALELGITGMNFRCRTPDQEN